MTLFLVLFPLLWISTQCCFLLDHLLFGGFRRQQVAGPVFILGNFRCGSTLLHRLLARDRRNFAPINSWEIYTAPSITQRKLLRGIKLVDAALLGGRLHKILMNWDKTVLGKVTIHPIGVHRPEEEEGLFFYVWYSLFLWFFFPDNLDRCRFDRFDEILPTPEKRRIMGFYRDCLKRHLFAHGGTKIFLSKNPSHTGRIGSLLNTFPDARCIYLYRDPEQVLSSTMSWFSFAMHYFADIPEAFPHGETIADMTDRFFTEAPPKLMVQDPSRYAFVGFEELTRDLEGTVKKLYRHFGIPMDNNFKAVLQAAAEESKSYRSTHRHPGKTPPAATAFDTEKLQRMIDSFPSI